MKFKFFWIPASDSARGEQDLNVFLAGHRVTLVEQHFHSASPQPPGWAICVQWIDGGDATPANSGSAQEPDRVDYRAVLDAPTFQIYSALRTWRKSIAVGQGVAIYQVANNEHLAQIARERIVTKEGLEKIHGFGRGRVEKYGEGLLAVCRKEIQSVMAAPPAPE